MFQYSYQTRKIFILGAAVVAHGFRGVGIAQMSYLERRLRAYHRYDVEAVRRIKPVFRKICQRSFHKPPLLGKSHTFLRIGLKGRAAGLDLPEMDPVEVLADYVQFQMALTAVAPQYAVPPGFQIAAYRLLSYASGLLSAAILFHISRN